jgi:hypothetical protein
MSLSGEPGPPFFVVGSARSGTTLLRLMLNAHPDVAVPPESRFVTELYEQEEVDAEETLHKLGEHHRFGAWELSLEDVRAELGKSGRVRFAEVISAAYRAYAKAHPGRYAATLAAPTRGDEEHRAAATEAVDVMLAVLRAWDLEGDDAVHAVRAFRSALHGFVAIEAADGFGMDVDVEVSFERLLATLAEGIGEPRPARAA